MKNTIDKQRDFFNSNKTKDIHFRILQLKKLKELLIKNESRFNQAIYDDFKKSAFDNYTNELALVYKEIDEAVKNIKKWSKIKRVRTNLINFPARSYIMPEPLGVCLVLGAWNYPIQLSLAPLVAAIAAGNTVILKPSELPANTSRALAELINNNFDPEFLKVIEGGIDITTQLLDIKFDKIFFTGSVPVGKIIYQAAAKHLTPVTLELGGKSPAIITEDCNLEVCAKRLTWAKFLNAGQTCIAPDYVLIHPSIKDKFLDLVKKEIQKENFSIENQNYVQIINEKNYYRLTNLLDASKIYFGGAINEKQRCIAPTVLHNVDFEDKIMQEEIFGPILPVITYKSIDEAIAKVKVQPKPLSCYIFSSSKVIQNKILRELSFGGGAINDAIMHVGNHHLPFGGVGSSGIGSYHGESGFRSFTHYKSILDKATWFEANLKYYPHTKWKLKIIKFLFSI